MGCTKTDEWVVGAGDTPFFTSTWKPSEGEPSAYVLFVHEHITRYDTFFTHLASTYSLHILAFDQRGHGRTSHTPLQPDSGAPEQIAWEKAGRYVKYEPKGDGGKRKTGGWKRIIPDIEFFVRREAARAEGKGKGLWLWGFSMGGGEVLKFATHQPFLTSPLPPSIASPSPLSLLAGVISGGPLIRQTRPASSVQLTAGSLASNLLPNMLIPTPLDFSDLSHDEESNARNKADPLCEQVGSLRGVADMLNGGKELDSAEVWARWVRDLPLLVYHGEEDRICDPQASRRFLEGVGAERKMYEEVRGMYHEVHNELPPVPDNLAKVIAEFILQSPDRVAERMRASGSELAEGNHEQGEIVHGAEPSALPRSDSRSRL